MIMESPGLQQIVSDSQTDQDVVVIGTPIQISVSSSPVRRLELDESFADSNASSPDQGDPNVSLQAAMAPHGSVPHLLVVDPEISVDTDMVSDRAPETPAPPDDEKYADDETEPYGFLHSAMRVGTDHVSINWSIRILIDGQNIF